ncbi:carboxylesterase 9 [Tripterygium wilfordii]|uniref:Carboxylesterase 9 n=1 Tax=Tripterygium wilfordii TaxID=458696 RepID=A0A7J7CC10_TRIWF|nr:probable carboxylesterase 9 [Tripterygium wilfordii]KAF5731678.1 carboxylesterase 9 [Tripterygium wilfordii]
MSKFDPFAHLNIKLNEDGTLSRLAKFPNKDANPEPAPGDPIATKDCTINNTFLRIFIPTVVLRSNSTTTTRLPIVFYLHGSSWILFDAANVAAYVTCTRHACEIPAIIIVPNCRLAPEHRIPTQYDDAVEAVLWVKQQALDPNGERWLKEYGDFSRCYLHGSGSGGNIVFNVALRVNDMDLKPLKIVGLIMNQPLFGGKQRTKSELKFATDQMMPLPVLDLIWELALPKGADRDSPYCNPTVDGPHKSKLRLLQRCLVIGFSKDPLIDRQQSFVEMLMMSGVKVDAQFDDMGFHRIELVDKRWAAALLQMVKEFILN